jgi:methyl-accepting chemotaxis protein
MKKLLWLTVGGLVMTMVLVVVQWQTSRRSRAMLERTLALERVARQTESIETNMMQMSDSMRGFLLDPTRREEWDQKLKADEALVAAVKAVQQSTQDAKLLELVSAIGKLDEERLNPTENKVLELTTKDRKAAVRAYFDEYLPIRKEQMQLVDALRQAATDTSNEFARTETSDLDRRTAWILWFCGGAIAIGAIGVAWSAWATLRLQNRMKRTADALGAGADEVFNAARQLSESAQALSRESSTQAASLEETSASMTEITAMTTTNAQHASDATRLMQDVQQRVTDTNTALAAMVTSMHEIKESSDKMSRIMRTVDEISFQTNILALNAAVEAARAGEAGLGFAVVAEEVRRLAQRSAEASRDTAGLIELSIATTSQGATRLEAVGTAIQAIDSGVRQTQSLIASVTTASREQADGTTQVTQTVQHMETGTQQVAAIAEANAASSEELQAQAEATQALVGELQELVGLRRARERADDDAMSPPAVIASTRAVRAERRPVRARVA